MPPLKTRPPLLLWLLLIVLSVALAAAMQEIGIPAGLMIGPMIASIALAVKDVQLKVPKVPFAVSQAVIGCLIAASLGPSIVPQMAKDWPLFTGAALATLAVAFGTGIVLARLRVLPGAVAVWGSAPGLATAMVLMARDSGADYRLVAFMTYLRMLMVALGATVLSMALGGHSGAGASAHAAAKTGMAHDPWFWPIDLHAAAATVAVCVAGALAGRLVRLPAADILGPMVLGTALHVAGIIHHLALPQILLAAAYMIVGWGIGSRFTPETIAQARSALPAVFASVIAMIAGCFVLGLLVAWATGVSIPTAYLATSPGGMAAIAVIAASSPVNVSFVLTLQTTRMAAILLFGPAIARAVARRFA